MGCSKGVKFVKWNSDEDNFLIKNYGKLSYTEMMGKLDRTRNSVKSRITVLSRKGLIAKSAREQMAKRSQFKSGHDSWNKGMKGFYAPGSEKGWFKKGHAPHNTRFNGAVRIRPHKRSGTSYAYIRIKLGKWKLLHRFNYEKHFGKIPKGAVITFNDGNTMNCKIENLKLITMKENAIRNADREKASITHRKNRRLFKDLENDDYIINLITRDKNLRTELKLHPEIIELKRTQLKLNRNIIYGLAKETS